MHFFPAIPLHLVLLIRKWSPLILHILMYQHLQEVTMRRFGCMEAGAVGVYLLLLTGFLMPLSLISWYLTRLMQNLKEWKDPLLMLERNCDL